MATTAEAYGFGARAPYAAPRASEYDMKERARLSGLFPRVRNEPLSKQLQGLLKEFEQNAALTGIMERRRRMDERLQYELKGREGMRALDMNRTPPLRAGMAGAATSARVAAAIADLPPVPPPVDAAAVMTGNRRQRAQRPNDVPPPRARRATARQLGRGPQSLDAGDAGYACGAQPESEGDSGEGEGESEGEGHGLGTRGGR